MRRAAPGPQLAAGRIRVDAGKAIAKLRDYQLADQRAWVLEAIRAAVTANATRIELRGDMNDVWLSWDGEPWPDDVLPRLFDELVSPEAARESHHVRLLAAAVNSALGMDPGYVDVIALRADGATRVRYTPEILVASSSELGESALRHVAAEAIARPDDARPGMLVHVRRKLSDWRLLGSQPELAIAHQACRDIAVPLQLGDQVLQRSAERDVVRLPLGEGLDGFISIGDSHPLHHTALLEVAERGVLLASYPIELLDAVDRGPVPIRVFIDAPRMPTNASRSQVRRDAHPIAAAERRAKELVPALIAELAKLVVQGSERARELALALVAARAGGAQWHVDVPAIQGPLRELAALPLVRNAVGAPRPLTSHWRAEVHKDRNAFALELAPWLETVLWIPPGDPAGRLLANAQIDARGTRRLARWARKQLRAQLRFYEHEKRAARVLSSATAHVRAPLGIEVDGSCVPQSSFDGLTGEICIYRDGDSGALAVLLEGRMLERIEFDSPLSFDVVVDSPRVTPGDRYRGVKHDAEYKRVERAMRAGLLRALEAHALDGGSTDAEGDAKLYRRGFGLIGEIGAPMKGPLTAAPAYRAHDGRWLGLVELAAQTAIGIAPPGKQVVVPRGRVVVELDEPERRALAKLVSGKLVPYRRHMVSSLDALATSMAIQGGGALVVREPGIVAVLTPSVQARLRLHHLATELDDHPRQWRWLPCVISVDADALIPDESWSALADDAGLRSRDYAAWELALVRAIASAIVGDPVDGWVCPLPPDLDSKVGLALCAAIALHDPRELLGEELLARLRAKKLLRVLGSTAACSIDEVAAAFPSAIPYIDHEAPEVAGFAPVIASKHVATAMAKLVGRDAVDGSSTVERYRRIATRERNLARHRLVPTQPLVVPSELHAPVTGTFARGLVAAWDGPFEIRVFVEGRPFAHVHPAGPALPLVAAVEVAHTYCDDTFESLAGDAPFEIANEVRAAIPALLATIASQQPGRLGDAGPARTLLAMAQLDDDTKKLLAAAPIFHTVQGGRTSIAQATKARLSVSTASWQGEWLGAEDETPHALDAPVVFVSDSLHEVAHILDKLHDGIAVDVTDEVTRLQSRRRIARGLVPPPKVHDAPAELKRPLAAFGSLGKQLGVGEIALVEDEASVVRLYQAGNVVRTESLDLYPPIALAVELAESQSLTEPVQQLAVELVKQVLASVPADQLSPRIQRNLLRAGLARRVDGSVLAVLPLWRSFTAQIEKLGNAWFVCDPTDAKPLDPERQVFFVGRSTLDLARDHGWNVVDATEELALDALARRNRGRADASSLDLPTWVGVVAEVTLDGDGVTSPRGIVAVLSPGAAPSRGLVPHRRMHPFDRVDDPCRWPTLAVIDDARLDPDRTWSKPVANDAWQAVVKEVRLASERALASTADVPEHALVHLTINNHACADVAALRKAPKSAIRGVLWLTGAPGDSVAVKVSEQQGTYSFEPSHGLAVGGRLYVFAQDGLDVRLALEQLCGQVHGKLVRMLLKRDDLDRSVVAAHVAHALFVRTIRATDARGIEFSCFSPRPLDARGLTSLLRRTDSVTVIKRGVAPDPDAIEVIDDGSVLADTVIRDLGERVRRQRPAPRSRPAPEAPTRPPIAPEPKQVPIRAQPPEAPHPLRPLLAKLRSRLADVGIGGYRWTIVDRAEPMLRYADEIELAGDNVRLRALAAALAADSPFATAGIDVVVAHLVTVLNVALSQITDASESHALGVLLANPPSAGRPRSRRSS
jgi:hypothetical protein